MTDYIRTQILLEKKQRLQLDEIAEKEGISFSEVVRNFLNSQLQVHAYREMQRAAELLRDDYTNDSHLTDMTALDSEEFING